MKNFIKTLSLIVCVLFLTGCGGVKLDNGENAIVTFDEGGISAEDLYNKLKENYGAENIVNLIDKYLLEKLYDTTSDEKSYIKQSVNAAKEQATKYNTDLDTYVYYYYGLANEKAYKEYISLNYKRSLWIEDYAEETVTDTQIKEYYETETVGDMTLSHILITSDATDDMSDDEKSKAETNALNQAKEIITKLQNGDDFASLAKEYSKDDSTASKGGSLGKLNTGDYNDDFINAAKDLEVGSYSTSPVKTSYGYHIIYKTAQDDKPTLEDATDDIRITVGKEIASDSSFYMTAMIALREKNNMTFKDSELESSYNDYIKKNQK